MDETSKRMSPRIPARMELTIRVGGRDLPGQIRTINLSGFFVSLGGPVPVNELLRMTIHVPDPVGVPLEATGWIRSCDLAVAGGAGVKLYGMSKEATDRWAAHYQRCRQRATVAPVRMAAAAG